MDRSNSFIPFPDSQRDNEHVRMALDAALAGIGGWGSTGTAMTWT
ncbi:MAG: hypothetical protein ACI38U_03695 [Corynebacterium sp.]|nr:hypothetical protein [Corynebacterium sp. CNJ-954]